LPKIGRAMRPCARRARSAWTGQRAWISSSSEGSGRLLFLECDAAPLVAVAEHPGRGGATFVLVCTHGRHHSFARATAALDQQGLNIQDARITPTADGGSLDAYLVLEDTGQPITERERMSAIERNLARALSERSARAPAVTRRIPRQVRMFTTPTQVSFSADPGEALERLIADEGETLEALQGAIEPTGREAASEAVEHRLEHMIMRKQEQVDYLLRAQRRP